MAHHLFASACLMVALLDPHCGVACKTELECIDAVDKLQINGTQRAFVDSLDLLNTALQSFPESAKLWGLLGKLHIFYLFQWDAAADPLEKSLQLNASVNSHLFSGWLASTPTHRNITVAEAHFLAALEKADPSDFWPHFEYGAWLSHIVDRFNESSDQYEVVAAKAPGNPFMQFFYGLLLKAHLGQQQRGEQMIQQAVAAAAHLPGQASGNLAFQAQLLWSRGRLEEARECCNFSAKILDPSKTAASFICSMMTQQKPKILV